MAAMPQALVTKSFDDSMAQVVVLAFDLVGQQAANLPSLLEKSLADKSVQDAIKSALDTFMLKRMSSGASMNALTPKDAQDLLAAIANSAGGKLGDAALKQIKDSSGYKNLQKAVDDFQAALKNTPLGVWVDKNSGIVFVTGVVLAIGGVAALYATKTGGTVVNLAASQLTNKPLQIFKVGKFTLQGQLLAFQPDKQTLGAGVIATQKWQQLQVSVTLGVVAAGPNVQQVNGQVLFKTQDVSVGVTAKDQPDKKQVDLGLSFGFGQSSTTPVKVGIGAIVTDGKVTGGALDASLKTGVGEFGLKGQEQNKQFQGLVTWTIPLP